MQDSSVNITNSPVYSLYSINDMQFSQNWWS